MGLILVCFLSSIQTPPFPSLSISFAIKPFTSPVGQLFWQLSSTNSYYITLSHIRRRGGGDLVVDRGSACVGRDRSALENSSPPHRRVEGTLVFME